MFNRIIIYQVLKVRTQDKQKVINLSVQWVWTGFNRKGKKKGAKKCWEVMIMGGVKTKGRKICFLVGKEKFGGKSRRFVNTEGSEQRGGGECWAG